MGGVALAAEKRRILVVDDVELNRTLTEAVLRGATYEVDSVGDGAAALAALDARPYDLVLMDLDMPGLHGHDAAAAIRERRCNSVVRLAALSSHSGSRDIRRSGEVGMAAHIVRPIAPHALLREIERVFCLPALRQTVETADPWQRKSYDDWASRLGAERMDGVLRSLRDQLEALLLLSFEGRWGAAAEARARRRVDRRHARFSRGDDALPRLAGGLVRGCRWRRHDPDRRGAARGAGGGYRPHRAALRGRGQRRASRLR